jgi:hypothetical protein
LSRDHGDMHAMKLLRVAYISFYTTRHDQISINVIIFEMTLQGTSNTSASKHDDAYSLTRDVVI